MTHKRLLLELGTGELAYWSGKFALTHDAYEKARAEAERKSNQNSRVQKLPIGGLGG